MSHLTFNIWLKAEHSSNQKCRKNQACKEKFTPIVTAVEPCRDVPIMMQFAGKTNEPAAPLKLYMDRQWGMWFTDDNHLWAHFFNYPSGLILYTLFCIRIFFYKDVEAEVIWS